MDTIKTLTEAVKYLETEPKVNYDPYPDYDDCVMNALNTTKGDTNYLANHEKIEDKPIDELNLKELATMYTFILRGERFCDGHIGSFIEDGTLLSLFRRHLSLLEKSKFPWQKRSH